MGKSKFRDNPRMATQWLWLYNNERPYTAVGGIPPIEVLKVA